MNINTVRKFMTIFSKFEKMFEISVIIPTLNAENYIDNLLFVLNKQTIKPNEIIVIDSKSDDRTVEICKTYENVKLVSIDRNKFDHGGTRDIAFRQSKGEIVLFLTQDAMPTDNYYIEKLIKPFKDKSVAMTSGRQIARSNANILEKLTREFNYPSVNNTRSKDDIKSLGIKTFFASDVCSAYRRNEYMAIGGFKTPIIISEDMIIAADLIYANKKIAYVADATVLHSHNYTLKQQFVRNFDTGVVMRIYKSKFENVSARQEGIRMVKFVVKNLFKKGYFIKIFYYCMESGVKLLGNSLGENYEKLSINLILKCTMNKNFWINNSKFIFGNTN